MILKTFFRWLMPAPKIELPTVELATPGIVRGVYDLDNVCLCRPHDAAVQSERYMLGSCWHCKGAIIYNLPGASPACQPTDSHIGDGENQGNVVRLR